MSSLEANQRPTRGERLGVRRIFREHVGVGEQQELIVVTTPWHHVARPYEEPAASAALVQIRDPCDETTPLEPVPIPAEGHRTLRAEGLLKARAHAAKLPRRQVESTAAAVEELLSQGGKDRRARRAR